MSKILFITDCLEPGKTGVGDYTRDLAAQCEEQGRECRVLALNDAYWDATKEIPAQSLQTTQPDGARAVPGRRFAAGSPWEQRMGRAQEEVDQFDPEWVSIQFVCYGYHPRGWVVGLADRLKKLCRGRKVQMMFHELWLGEGQGSSWKHRLEGALQKRLVLDLVRRLQPQVIHVNCSAYRSLLERNGVAARRLPLFGSVPIAAGNGDGWLFPLLTEAGIGVSPENRSRYWISGLFGSLHPEWEAEPLFSYLQQAGNREGRQCVILSIGRRGAAGDALWLRLADRYRKEIRLVDIGELPAQRVSEIFQSLDYGIAATPQGLIGKSASATAMIEHGLPVIVTRDDFRLRFPFAPEEMNHPQLIPLSPALVQELARLKRGPARSELKPVTELFLSSLRASSAVIRGCT